MSNRGATLAPSGSSSQRSYATQAAAAIGSLSGGIARRITTAIRESQFRSAVRELQRLDDRTLKDIGVSRSEIIAIVSVHADVVRSPLRTKFGLRAGRED
jgi:uncharacterized protein YjiS (DUF1127 family)